MAARPQQGADFEAKYEALLQTVLKEIETTIDGAQQNAEAAVKRSEEYTSALKKELDEGLRRQRDLEEELATTRTELAAARDQLAKYKGEQESRRVADDLGHLDDGDDVTSSTTAPDDVLQFLTALTCLGVSVQQREGGAQILYHCTIEDGQLQGHHFSLTLNKKTWEYTYQPSQDSTHPLLSSSNSDLASRLQFPDYMLSRFFVNLLLANYEGDHMNQ